MKTSTTVPIVATTSAIEGCPVHEYLGIVSAEATMRTSIMPRRRYSWAATIEGRLFKTRDRAIALMIQRAVQVGATAIIAVDIDYEVVRRSGGEDLLIVSASGTAVTLRRRKRPDS